MLVGVVLLLELFGYGGNGLRVDGVLLRAKLVGNKYMLKILK